MRLLLCALLVAGCGSKKKDAPEPAPPAPVVEAEPAPPPPPTAADALWNLAPTDAVAGIVVADGGLPQLRDSWSGVDDIARDDPFTAAIAADARAGLRASLGFDPLDATHGDARGVAVFLDGDGAVMAVVLPPGLVSSDAGAAVSIAGLPCREHGDRTWCSATAPSGEPGPLAVVVTSLPPERRGVLELAVDAARVPAWSALRERVAPVLDRLSSVTAALSLERGVARLRVLVRGTPGSRGEALLRTPTAAPLLDELSTSSASSLRLSIDPSVLAGGESAIADQLAGVWTGEVGLFARGSGVLSGVVAIGVADEARARKAIGPICNALLRPLGPIQRLDDTECRVAMAMPREAASAEPVRERLYAAFADTPITLDVHRGALRIRFGEPSEPSPPGTPLDRGGLELRASALGPLALADDELAATVADAVARLPAERRALVAGLRWILANLAEVRVSLGLTSEGAYLDVSAAGFGADDAGTYADYRAAVGSLRAGDRPGFRRALESLRAAHPNTRAARQADAVLGGAPVIGPASLVGLMTVPALVEYVRAYRAGEPAANRR